MGRKKEVVFTNGRWSGQYLSESDCNRLDVLRSLSEQNGSVDDLKHLIYDLSPHEVDLVCAGKTSEFIEKNMGTLEDHQTIGVAFMYFAKRLLLGDSVGLGKTVEVAALCNLLQVEYEREGMPFRYLFLTEKTSLSQIRKKMVRFTGEYAEILPGEKSYVQRFISENENSVQYSVVGSHSLFNNKEFQQYFIDYYELNNSCPFDILIVDESGDILTNMSNQTYNNAVVFANMFDRVICLNATSFESALNQMYAQLNFLDPTFMPTKTNFESRYHELTYGIRKYGIFTGKYKNQEEFLRLVGYRYFKCTRKLIGCEMKDCSAEIITSVLSPIQKKLLKIASNPLMVYDCPGYFASSNFDVETNVDTTPKLASLIDLLEGKLSNERSVLIYSRYKEAQSALSRLLEFKGISHRVMNGDTPGKTRDEYINNFILGDIKVLITNVQKGLDFGECNHCIFYDYDPNPSKMVQFEGRMTRSRDIIGKHVYLLLSEGKELKTFKSVVADRAKASDVFSGSDFSNVLSLLLDNSEVLGEDVNVDKED